MQTRLSELCKFIDAIDRDECSSASMKVILPIEWDCGGRRPVDLAPSVTTGHRETMIDRSFVFFVRETVKELKVYKKRFPDEHPLYFAWMVNSKEKVNPRTPWMELLYVLVKLRLQEYRQFDRVYFRRVGEQMPKAWGLQDLVICEYIEKEDCTGGLHSHASIVGFRRVDDVPSDWYSAVSDQFKKKVHWSFAPEHMTRYYWSLGSWQLLPGFEVFRFLLESVPEEQRQACLRGNISDKEWRHIYECYGGEIEFTECPQIEDIPLLRAKVDQHLSETMGPVLEQLKSSSAWMDDNKKWHDNCERWTITDYFRFKKLERDDESSSLSTSELKRRKVMSGEEWEEDEEESDTESEEEKDTWREKFKKYQERDGDWWRKPKKGGWTVSPLTPENFPLQIFEDDYQIYEFAPSEDVFELFIEKPCYPSVAAFEGTSRADCKLNDLQPSKNSERFKLTNACRTLYAMVASFFPKRAGFGIPQTIVPRAPYFIPDDPFWRSYSDEEFQERSKEEKDFCVQMNWELIGVTSEERSNILFVCSCGWLMEREKYRVVYMPNPREVFRDWKDDRLLKDHFMFAFSGEPISAVIRKTKDMTGSALKLIDQYLESQNLYLLVVVDHLDDKIAGGGYSRMCHFVNEDCRRIVLIGNYYRPEEDDDKRSSRMLSTPDRLDNLKIDVKTA